jgi:hypothetical protein
MSEEQKADSIMAQLEEQIRLATGYPNIRIMMRTISDYVGQIPDTVATVDGHTARELAARFLKGQSLCADLVAIAEFYEGKMARKQKAAYSEAFIDASDKFKTQKEKESYAEISAAHVEAAEEYMRAKMFRLLIENKREDLEKAHYFMRKIAEGDTMAPPDLPSVGNTAGTQVARRNENGRVTF